MAFPATPLDIVAAIAPGADPVSPTGWVFTDISDDVRSASGVTITAGRTDELGQVDATRVACTVDNTTGDYCRTNPLGAYFGRLSRGTPLEVRVTRISDTFSRTTSPGLGTDAVSGLAWTHLGSSNWATTGAVGTCTLAAANTATHAFVQAAAGADVEITGTVALSAVTTGAAWVHAVIVRAIDSSNLYRLHVEFTTAGTISCKIAKTVGGTFIDLTANTATGVSYSAGTAIAYRARVVGSTLQIRAWLASGSEPSTWTAQVDDDEFPEAGVPGIYSWRVAGNTNAGSLVATIDNYRIDVIRAITPVPEWPARWDQSGNDATVPIAGAGVLRRLSQGQPALRSPIYRQLSGLTSYVQGYWPLEDQSGATVATSALSGGQAATVTDVDFGSDDCPPGASAAATLNTAGASRIFGRVTRWTAPTNGYAAMMYIRLPTLSASAGPVAGNRVMTLTTVGTVVKWVIYATSTGWYIEGYLADGTLQVNTGSFAYTYTPSQWMALQLEAIEDGSDVDWALLWHQVGGTVFQSASGTFAGTADRATSVEIRGPVDSTMVSHLWVGDDLLPFVDSTFQLVSDGYAGETAGARMVRLADEESLPLVVVGDTADTSPMGAQTSATLLDLLRECEDADLGVLHERGAGLGYLTRASRYNTGPVMVLDFASGHIAAPPEPTDDDQRLRNQVTVTRSRGSSVTARDEDSIAVDGLYSDDLTVNVETDGQATDHAYWRLHLGTLEGLRWPSITLDLARNPSLIDEWCRVRIGSRITIANPPDQVGTDGLDLIVEGWTETLSEHEWKAVLACSPASAWQVAVYDGTDSRYDLATCTMSSTATAGATSLTLAITAEEAWSTTAEPYDLFISGERVTVTSMAARTGSVGAYQQVATVTRAVNGISKSLPAGAEVHIADPARYAI